MNLLPIVLAFLRHSNNANDPFFASRLLLLGTIFISPLLFGSVYLWSSTILEFGAFCAFTIYSWKSRLNNHPRSIFKLNIYFLPLLIFLFVVALQLVPLPAGIFTSLFVERAEFWQQPYILSGRQPAGPFFLSFFPGGTLVEFSRFLAYTLASYLTYSLIQADYRFADRQYTARSLTWIISITGFIASLVAILQAGLGATAIYGFWTPLHSTSFMGPYVNRNHLAGLLEMCLPMQLGLLTLQYITKREHSPLSRSSTSQRWHSSMVFLYLMFFITLCGLLFTLSRAGIIIGISSLIIQTGLIIIVFAKHRNNKLVFILSLLCLAILVGVTFSFDFDALTQRFQTLSLNLKSNLRWSIAKDSWHIFLSFPWLGTGLGSYQTVLNIFKTSNTQLIIDHAHQDYLEMLAELGFLGALAFFTFFVQALIRGINQIRWVSGNSERIKSEKLNQLALILSAATGVLALLMHGLVDFNIRIPANALYLFVLAGILLGLAAPPKE